MNAKAIHREQVSALADDNWSTSSGQDPLRTLVSSDAKATWLIYHQIGDVLRSSEHAEFLDDSFDRRFRARFAAEPVFFPVHSRRHSDSQQQSEPVSTGSAWNFGALSLYGKRAGGIIGTAAIAAVAAFFFSATSHHVTAVPGAAHSLTGSNSYAVARKLDRTPVLLDTPSSAVTKPGGTDQSVSINQPDKPLSARPSGASALTPVVHAGAGAPQGGFSSNKK